MIIPGKSFFSGYRDADQQCLFIGKNAYGVKVPRAFTRKPILYENTPPTHFVVVFREKIA